MQLRVTRHSRRPQGPARPTEKPTRHYHKQAADALIRRGSTILKVKRGRNLPRPPSIHIQRLKTNGLERLAAAASRQNPAPGHGARTRKGVSALTVGSYYATSRGGQLHTEDAGPHATSTAVERTHHQASHTVRNAEIGCAFSLRRSRNAVVPMGSRTSTGRPVASTQIEGPTTPRARPLLPPHPRIATACGAATIREKHPASISPRPTPLAAWKSPLPHGWRQKKNNGKPLTSERITAADLRQSSFRLLLRRPATCGS